MRILFARLVDKYLTGSPVLTQWIVPTGEEEKLKINAEYHFEMFGTQAEGK